MPEMAVKTAMRETEPEGEVMRSEPPRSVRSSSEFAGVSWRPRS